MADIMAALENIGAHLKAEAESVTARFQDDLPVVQKFVADAASNPVTAALAAAVHLPGVPSALQTVAGIIASMDAAIGDAKAQAAAEAQAAAAAAAQPPAA